MIRALCSQLRRRLESGEVLDVVDRPRFLDHFRRRAIRGGFTLSIKGITPFSEPAELIPWLDFKEVIVNFGGLRIRTFSNDDVAISIYADNYWVVATFLRERWRGLKESSPRYV